MEGSGLFRMERKEQEVGWRDFAKAKEEWCGMELSWKRVVPTSMKGLKEQKTGAFNSDGLEQKL